MGITQAFDESRCCTGYAAERHEPPLIAAQVIVLLPPPRGFIAASRFRATGP